MVQQKTPVRQGPPYPTSVQMTAEELAELEELSDLTGIRSKSDVIRFAIRQTLNSLRPARKKSGSHSAA